MTYPEHQNETPSLEKKIAENKNVEKCESS